MDIQQLAEKDVETIVDKVFSQQDQFVSIEGAYHHLAKAMCENFLDKQGESDLVLSRVYHSFDYSLLPSPLQSVAKEVWGESAKENNKFITLMGTYGKELNWQDRHLSKGHRAILLNRETLKSIPMVSRLIQQIGFDIGTIIGEKSGGIEFEGISGTFGVFYVSPALGSAYIPAQDFVEKYQVKSVIGTGVMLPQGDISIYIGFTKAPVSNEVAANLAPLMSLFWQRAYSLLDELSMFSEGK